MRALCFGIALIIFLVLNLVPVAEGQEIESALQLIDAIKSQDLDRARILLDEGVNVDGRQADGATALHWAHLSGGRRGGRVAS